MKYVVVFFFLACLSCESLMAQSKSESSPGEIIQREQLKQEQKNIEATFASREADCYKKFSVNPCIDKARIEKNAAMADNKRRELLLNDQKREAKQQNALKMPKVISPNSEQTDDAMRKLPDKEIIDPNKRDALARGRVEATNKKKRQAQVKADKQMKKNALSGEAAAKYQKKITAAEAHKASVEQRNAGNTKPKSLPLTIPKVIEN